ncbi:IS66 family transposase [Pseudoruegeria sp. HB172150]|uniref:IS66 family transposase n=1 Tax=Pseudoruegeria sp. HB172150 TaxID=2721164 RepID=UPI0020A638F0|nr:IS66 family transposase [Pseudoruegeria sp. HB172150]
MASKNVQKKRFWSDEEKRSICAQTRALKIERLEHQLAGHRKARFGSKCWSTIAKETIERIARLYAVEKEARYRSSAERVALQQAKAKPIFDDLEDWLKIQLPKISGKTKLAEAIRYALDRMPKAQAYLEDSQLELDNNICERSIRPLTSGWSLCTSSLSAWKH